MTAEPRVAVTIHAEVRLGERAPDLVVGDVAELVSAALAEGRSSRRLPRVAALRLRRRRARIVYCWAEGRDPLFVLHEDRPGRLVVVTVLRRQDREAA